MTRAPAFYPKNWRGSYWLKVEPTSYREFKNAPGVYAVYADGKLIYIGQSGNMRKRIHGHAIHMSAYSSNYFTPWGQFRDVLIKVRYGRRLGDWAMREVRLIARLQPPCNCAGSVRKKGMAA